MYASGVVTVYLNNIMYLREIMSGVESGEGSDREQGGRLHVRDPKKHSPKNIMPLAKEEAQE
jgi:hypothetical protein